MNEPLTFYNVPPWWRHQMETFSALLVLCAGNSLVTGEFPTQRPVTLSFDVSFDLRLNKCLSKQSRGWWFETPSRSLWRHRNDFYDLLFKWQLVCKFGTLERNFLLISYFYSCFHTLPKFCGSSSVQLVLLWNNFSILSTLYWHIPQT